MPKIAIVTDSGADLPQELCARYGITVVPLVVRFGEEVYLDGQLSVDEFWKKAEKGPPYPQTSQPATGMFEQVFAELIGQGNHVLCLTITSKHSGTLNSAYAAAQNFPGQVTVFDTLSLSLAQAYQAITAAKAAAEGKSLEEILTQLENIRARTHLFIVLDTIEYLRRGGRADQIIPVLERVVRMLNIKPILEVIDGQLKLLGAARSREKGLERIQQEIASRAPAEMLIVVYTRQTNAAAAPSFARTLAECIHFPLEQVMMTETGAVLSSHAGPGVIAAAIVQHKD
nr:DegV family protein [Chloroflexota bacterium]